jgi:hypothetical protein
VLDGIGGMVGTLVVTIPIPAKAVSVSVKPVSIRYDNQDLPAGYYGLGAYLSITNGYIVLEKTGPTNTSSLQEDEISSDFSITGHIKYIVED